MSYAFLIMPVMQHCHGLMGHDALHGIGLLRLGARYEYWVDLWVESRLLPVMVFMLVGSLLQTLKSKDRVSRVRVRSRAWLTRSCHRWAMATVAQKPSWPVPPSRNGVTSGLQIPKLLWARPHRTVPRFLVLPAPWSFTV